MLLLPGKRLDALLQLDGKGRQEGFAELDAGSLNPGER
jgi:hypothetical protein